MKTTHFERAIFLSWYCAKGDCKFCYMSTQKSLIRDPRKARRSTASILAEAFLCKKLGWKIEFLSGGYESYTTEELLNLIGKIRAIYGEKLWLNIGVLNEKELRLFKPYIQGVCGAVECINPKIHDKVCPSKPIKEIESMFRLCDKLGLKKSMTIIIGLGETINDFPLLKKFIRKHKINKITFYRLKPHKGTPFRKGPKTDYYLRWIRKTRKEFPKLEIVAGSWLTHLDEIHLLLDGGADAITKFPSIKLFNSKYAKKIEQEAKKAGRKFTGTLTKLPKINYNDLNKFDEPLKEQITAKLNIYISRMKI
ncbi:MAG: radical SAM protein [Candidatus Omnitrophota bacterium]|nr:MAG: radical SAM protein [Candidatus Omnitrophota bacterium]